MSSDVETASEAQIRQMIAEWAYRMWENEGKPHGGDVIHWLQAEQDIKSCVEPSKPSGRGARAAAPAPPEKAKVTASPNS